MLGRPGAADVKLLVSESGSAPTKKAAEAGLRRAFYANVPGGRAEPELATVTPLSLQFASEVGPALSVTRNLSLPVTVPVTLDASPLAVAIQVMNSRATESRQACCQCNLPGRSPATGPRVMSSLTRRCSLKLHINHGPSHSLVVIKGAQYKSSSRRRPTQADGRRAASAPFARSPALAAASAPAGIMIRVVTQAA